MEGVDDPADARRLRRLGVDLAQGFLWAQALTVPDLLDWLAGGPHAPETVAGSDTRPV